MNSSRDGEEEREKEGEKRGEKQKGKGKRRKEDTFKYTGSASRGRPSATAAQARSLKFVWFSIRRSTSSPVFSLLI